MPQHPDTQQLLRLSQGRLPADESRALHAHVNTCTACQLAVKALPPAGRPPAVPGYEVLGRLGAGGVGVVYQARHLALKRLVALKFLRDGDLADEADRARFRREMEALAGLRHPNLIQIYEVGEASGGLFCALEFMEGGSLAERAAGRPQPADQAARLVELIAGAVQAAHDRGIVHRDLKPANVLLAADGTPKVADFGLAKRLGEAGPTVSDAVVGTPAYMAPEQAAGMRVGPTADVWALGAVLYELLTGRPPFLAETSVETLLQVLSDEPLPPRRLNPKVPRDLETICLKCLRKERGGRYASAADLADDLRRFLDRRPIRARPVGPVGRLARACRRRPLVAALAAGVVAAVALGFTGVLWQWRAAVAARDRSENNYRLALSTNVAVADLGDELMALAGTQPAAVERILAVAAERQESLLREAGESPAALAALGRMYATFSEVYIETGDTAKALDAGRRGRRLFDRLLRVDPDCDEYLAGLAASLERVAVATAWRGDQAEALRLHREALAIRQGLADSAAGDPDRLFDVSTSQQHVGNVLAVQGDAPRAKAHWGQALALRRRLDAAGLLDARRRLRLALSLEKMADAAYQDRDYAAARADYQSAIAVVRKRMADRPDDPEAARHLPRLLTSLGNACSLLGQADQAERQTREARALAEARAQTQPRNMVARLDLLRCRIALGDMRRGRAIVPALRDQLAAMREVHGFVEAMWQQQDRANALWRKDLATVQGVMAAALATLVRHDAEPAGKLDEAWGLLEQARGHARELVAADPTNHQFVALLADLHFKASFVLEARGDQDGATREAVAGWQRLLDFSLARVRSDGGHAWWHRQAAERYEMVGAVQLAAGRHAEAAAAVRQARDAYRLLQGREPLNPEWRFLRARLGFALAAALDGQAGAPAKAALDTVVESVDALTALAWRSATRDRQRADWLRALGEGHGKLGARLREHDAGRAQAQFARRLDVVAELLRVDPAEAAHHPFRPDRLAGSTTVGSVPRTALIGNGLKLVQATTAAHRQSPADVGYFYDMIEAHAGLVDALDETDAEQAEAMRLLLTQGRDLLLDRRADVAAHPVYRAIQAAFERRLARLGEARKRAGQP